MTGAYDLVFVGNASLDEIHTFGGQVQTLFGGGVAFSAMSAVWTGKRIAVVTRLAEADDHRLGPLRAAGIDVYPTYTAETTRHVAYHLSADEDRRRVLLLSSAGPPLPSELDGFEPAGTQSALLHLAALTDRECSLDFLEEAAQRGFSASVDLQGFIRQADPQSGEVRYGPVPQTRRIFEVADRIKLDSAEAEFLTRRSSIEEAAVAIEEQGARETLVTSAHGALVRSGGRTYVAPFSNLSAAGRTGRGDTTFGAYLACRVDRAIPQALGLAASVASIKLERPGLFQGTKEQVLERAGAVRR